MATPRTLTLLAFLAAPMLAGCASRDPRAELRSVTPEPPRAVLVENQSHQRIDVYIIERTRERHLGRLAPGARSWLPLRADEAADADAGMMQLAVIADAPRSLSPGRDAHAVVTPRQPLGTMLGQHWVFADGRLSGHLGGGPRRWSRTGAERRPGGRFAPRT